MKSLADYDPGLQHPQISEEWVSILISTNGKLTVVGTEPLGLTDSIDDPRDTDDAGCRDGRAVIDMTEQRGCCEFSESDVFPSRPAVYRRFECDFSAEARTRCNFVDKARKEISDFGPQTAIAANLFFGAHDVRADTARLATPLKKYTPGDDEKNARSSKQNIDCAVSRSSRLVGVPTREECRDAGKPTIPRPFKRHPYDQRVTLPVPGTFRTAPVHLPTIAWICGLYVPPQARRKVKLMRKAHVFFLSMPDRALTQFKKQTGIAIVREF